MLLHAWYSLLIFLGPEARVIGKAKLISCENIARCFPPKSKSGANVPHFHPRHRRQIEEKSIKDNHDHDGTNLIHEIHIETPKVLLKHQKSGGTTINPIKIKLAQPEVPLLAPSYKLVVRGSQNSILSVNDTVPFPTCLYHGTIAGDPHSNVSISTCDGNNIVSILKAGVNLEMLCFNSHHFAGRCDTGPRQTICD